MRRKLLSLLLALTVALPGLLGTAWASPMEDETAPPPEEFPIIGEPVKLDPRQWAVRPAGKGRSAGVSYFGDGSDGDLYIAAGQTVTLPVTVPHQTVVQKYYRNITIEAGGVLTTDAPNAGLVLKATGTVTINGTIDQSAKAPKTNPYNNYPYPTELVCGTGGIGGNVRYIGSGSGPGAAVGGAGMQSRSYGGGYSGGGAGGLGMRREAYAASGNGGSASDIVVSIADIFIGGGGNSAPGLYGGGGAGSSGDKTAGKKGGSNPGEDGVSSLTSYDYEGGGGGGAGNMGGGVVLIYVRGDFNLLGQINCSGGNGGKGGSSRNSGGGGGGSGGGGAGGGGVYVSYGGSLNHLGAINVNGGVGGAIGGDAYGATYFESGTAGTAGTFTVQKAPDTTPPVISTVSVTSAWATTNTATVTATDDMTGVAEYAITTTNAAPSSGWQQSNSFALTANGQYYAWAKDGLGNVSLGKAFTVSRVDNSKPIITSATVAPAGWANSTTKTITIAASDEQSGIEGYGLTANTTDTISWQKENTFTREEGTYYVWAKDLVGNISSYQQIHVDKIDTIKPVISSVSVPTVWSSSNNIIVYAADSGGSRITEYAVTADNTAPAYGWQDSGNFTINANGSYFAWAKDGAKNISGGKAFSVDKVDADKPIVESVTIPDKWAVNSTVTLQATDVGSGIAAYAVTVTSAQPSAGNWQAGTDFTLSSNGDYHAWAMDLAGNISVGSKFKIDKVDTTAPNITEVELPIDWGLDNTAIIQAEDAESGIADYVVSSYSFAPSAGWQTSGSFTIARNGDYYAFAKDKAGNISASAKFTISKVDLDKPVITAVTMPTEWCSAGTLTISATDNSSIADYALSTGSTVPVEGWQTSSSFAITQNGSYYAWARDEVGNVSSGKYCYISKIDSTPPEIASITWSTSGDTVTVRSKDLASGVAFVYIDDVAYSGSYATATLAEEVRYIRIAVEDVAGNKSVERQERVPGWYDELETLTILPVKFTENNQQATITAASTGAAVKGIYVNDKLKMGNPVTVLVSHGTQYLEVQALDINGDRSIIYQVRVPGWNAVVSTLEIVDVQFAEDNKTAKITAMETGGKGLRGIYINGELFGGNPVVYDIPAGVQHLEMQAEDNFGDRSALLIRRVPGWSEIVTTMSITDITYLDYNTTVQVTATAAGGDTISGIEVNGELQEGNPVIYKIPKGVELLKLQAVNPNGDRSPLVTKSVPKDATKGTLKIAIDGPSWTSSDKARVRVTVSDSSRITEVMARTSEDNEWVDITDSRYIFITADTTVYASVENEKGELRETSKLINCFDNVAPKVTATQDGNVVNIRATDDKSGVKSILVNNKVYSDDAIFDGKLAYRIPDGTSQITVYAEDAAGNLSSAVDLPLQVTVTAMPVIVSPKPETSSQPQPPEEVAIPTPEQKPEPEPEPPLEPEPILPQEQAPPINSRGQAAVAVGGMGTTAIGGVWYWLRHIKLSKPIEELELLGKKLIYDESEYGGAIDPDDRQGGNKV